MQRPFFSQSPKRVGSGPCGPPDSTASWMSAAGRACEPCAPAGSAAATSGTSTSEGAFGTGANSARIAPARPYETPSKTKMSKSEAVNLSEPARCFGRARIPWARRRALSAGATVRGRRKARVGASTLAGLHNPQGRVVALLALARSASDELLAVLPQELAGAVASRLRKYVLRSKLQIERSGTRCGSSAATPKSPVSPRWHGARAGFC